MIRELYSKIACGNYGKDRISREIKEEIANLLKEREEKTDSCTYDKCQEDLYLIAAAAEESGFVKGFQFAFRLFAEVCGNKEI